MPSARKTVRHLDVDPNEFDVEVVGHSPLPPPLDPAKVAAGLLLRRALEGAATTYGEAGRDGSVCLVSAPPEWAEAIRDAWRDAAREGGRYEDGTVCRSWSSGNNWIAWAPTEPPPKPGHDPGVVAGALWKGRHLFGVAADPDWLPADLVAAADHRLTLPVPTGADLALVVARLCGDDGVVPVIPDDLAAGLTPRVLRLACRPGQGAAAYVGKLLDVLARDRARPAVEAAVPSPRNTPTLDRLPGMGEATVWGRDLARDLAAYRRGELPWAAVDKGLLLYGPPGTGKTTFARALATSCGVPLVVGSLGQWQASKSGHLGDLLKAMRCSFDAARAAAPSILFIDEVDGFGDREAMDEQHRDYWIQVVNGFLELLDGATSREGVVVVGACNHPSRLDPAIVRSGRLDRSIAIPLPGRDTLAAMLRVHLDTDLAGADLGGAALMLAGGTGTDCERAVRGARRRARHAGRPMVPGDLLAEVAGEDGRTDAERRLAAVHEAGHAVAVLELRPGALLSVSVRESGRSGGQVRSAPQAEYFSGEALRDQLVTMLSGRAAEEEILGAPSSGAGGGPGSDMARATMLAAMAVIELALDADRSGLMWSGVPDMASLASRLALDAPLAARVRELMAEAYGRARQLVRDRRGAVMALAEVLGHRLVLDGEEVAAVVREAS